MIECLRFHNACPWCEEHNYVTCFEFVSITCFPWLRNYRTFASWSGAAFGIWRGYKYEMTNVRVLVCNKFICTNLFLVCKMKCNEGECYLCLLVGIVIKALYCEPSMLTHLLYLLFLELLWLDCVCQEMSLV